MNTLESLQQIRSQLQELHDSQPKGPARSHLFMAVAATTHAIEALTEKIAIVGDITPNFATIKGFVENYDDLGEVAAGDVIRLVTGDKQIGDRPRLTDMKCVPDELISALT